MYSSLTNKNIHDAQYKHVFNVWNKFEVKTMKDYNLYSKCWRFDVFSKNSLKNYGLCPSHYLRPPGLSWNSMLEMTKTMLELAPDSVYMFYISNRYIKDSNKYLKSYDPKQESKHVHILRRR